MTRLPTALLDRHETAARAHLPTVRLVIGGEERANGHAPRFEHINPTTGRVQDEIPMATAADIEEAVRAARSAFPAWRDLHPAKRRDILIRLADLVREHDWTVLQALENGQPLSRAQRTSMIACDWTNYYASWADKLEGLVTANNSEDGFIYTVPEPHGVVAVVIAWNAPLLFLGMKVMPALAAGNTVVIKPGELAPFTTMRWYELARAAGVPEGVINVVPGGPEAGAALTAHPDVDKVSFTGGPQTAKAIMRSAADNLTPLLLELGGKGANLIFADAVLDEAVPFSCLFGLTNSGQGCALPTRILVERSVYSEVVGLVEAMVASLTVGDPLDPATATGPLINNAAMERVLGFINEAKAEGSGKLLTGGNRLDGELANGFFVDNTVFIDVDPLSQLAQQEIFGPVLSITPFEDEDEAVRIANGTEYGLSNYIQTTEPRRVHRLVRALRSGTIGVNSGGCIHPTVPFGGVGLSGFGREGGRAGFEEFTRTKSVIWK